MPFSNTSSSHRNPGRDVSDRMVNLISRYALVGIAILAAGISIYAFTISFAEGARALIFFLIPSMWGAYCLAVLDGKPAALRHASVTLLNVMAAVAGLVVAAVVLLDAPVSIANLPLGIIECLFFVMQVGDRPGRGFAADYSEVAKSIVRMVLILATVLCIVVAVAL